MKAGECIQLPYLSCASLSMTLRIQIWRSTVYPRSIWFGAEMVTIQCGSGCDG